MSRKKKIPTRTELLQLQKLYKTDEKIGERLGGVQPYLVAYWRRKKNIPKYSLPKFSELEIRNLWERYGDDEKAGLELAISKAAFYNWRRRYGLKEKPAFLKLEQLEFVFPGSKSNGGGTSTLYGHRAVAQKLFARTSGIEDIKVGQQIEIEPDLVLLSSEAASIIPLFKKLNIEYVKQPAKVAIMLSAPPAANKQSATAARTIREFAKRQGIKNIYEWSEGTPYQLALENGHFMPGQISVASSLDHLNGCLGTLGMTATANELAQLLATGKYSVAVPPTVKLTINGRRPKSLMPLDIALAISKQIGNHLLIGRVVELFGTVPSQMTISERLTLCALLPITGCVCAIAPYDAATRRFLTGRTGSRLQPVLPDKDAEYEASYQIHIDQFEPRVLSVRNHERATAPDKNHLEKTVLADKHHSAVRAVAELENTTLNEIVIGGIAGGRFEELRQASEILKGKQVAGDCRLFVIPDSRQVYLEALKKGLIRIFLDAGATVVTPASAAEPLGLLSTAEGDKRLTTGIALQQQLNDRSDTYLCSVVTAAASALNGSITDPSRYVR